MIYELDLNKTDKEYFKIAMKKFSNYIEDYIISKKNKKIILYTTPFFDFDLFKIVVKKFDKRISKEIK